ncbi:hypothetical protein O3P69_013334 [Scylla paramamosain]|uniref:Uncharacterized protein n=1 Tax=Scylla paramamosain TaxID=85552 RepID=A0AAW0U2U4_SCYPA
MKTHTVNPDDLKRPRCLLWRPGANHRENLAQRRPSLPSSVYLAGLDSHLHHHKKKFAGNEGEQAEREAGMR